MKKINITKFKQNPELRVFLKKTAQVLVEANPYDKSWGVGTGINDSKTYNKEQWQGSNDLGKILVEVKAALSHKCFKYFNCKLQHVANCRKP